MILHKTQKGRQLPGTIVIDVGRKKNIFSVQKAFPYSVISTLINNFSSSIVQNQG
jgi:hypothetical protein